MTPTAAYVSALGMRMARRPSGPTCPGNSTWWTTPTVNAFALPGGFIYVTRGLMTYINDEAELATVVGHEIGHVTNRHSVHQISKAQLAQLGLASEILSLRSTQLAGVASRPPGLSSSTARMRRTRPTGWVPLRAEPELRRERDGQGVRHARPVSEASGGRCRSGSRPTRPGNRVTATPRRLDTLGSLSNTIVNRDEFLRHSGADLR